MNDSLNQYHVKTADWRHLIQLNTRRSYGVIITFILLYMLIGLVIDLFLAARTYPQASVGDLTHAIFTGQIFPTAMLITGLVAVFSLWITFIFHDKLMLAGTEYHEITPTNAKDTTEQQLYNVVEELKIAAGLKFMPKVYLIEADYMNAFASGYSEKSAMVAITRGLIGKLNRSELTAVMAHEISHIRHLDIKLTLFAAVLSNLMLMLIDLLFFNMIFSSRRNENSRGQNQLWFIIIILRYLMPLLTMLLMLYLSRVREYMADAGCVELQRDNQPLASALLKIEQDHQQNRDEYAAAYRQTPHENIRREAYIFDPVQAGIEPMTSLADLFSTHPSTAQRLRALGITLKDNEK